MSAAARPFVVFAVIARRRLGGARGAERTDVRRKSPGPFGENRQACAAAKDRESRDLFIEREKGI